MQCNMIFNSITMPRARASTAMSCCVQAFNKGTSAAALTFRNIKWRRGLVKSIMEQKTYRTFLFRLASSGIEMDQNRELQLVLYFKVFGIEPCLPSKAMKDGRCDSVYFLSVD